VSVGNERVSIGLGPLKPDNRQQLTDPPKDGFATANNYELCSCVCVKSEDFAPLYSHLPASTRLRVRELSKNLDLTPIFPLRTDPSIISTA